MTPSRIHPYTCFALVALLTMGCGDTDSSSDDSTAAATSDTHGAGDGLATAFSCFDRCGKFEASAACQVMKRACTSSRIQRHTDWPRCAQSSARAVPKLPPPKTVTF